MWETTIKVTDELFSVPHPYSSTAATTSGTLVVAATM